MDKNYLSAQAQVAATAILEPPVRVYRAATLHKEVRVGRFTLINLRSTLLPGTEVGRYCSIGTNVEIGVLDHPMERLSSSSVSYSMAVHFPDHAGLMPQKKLSRPRQTFIGNDVWIGTNAIIKRGVRIGDGAVIAAGAFVSRDVAPYEIAGGTPARPLRSRFAPEIVAELLALKWWDLEVSDLATVPFDDLPAALARLRDIRRAEAG